MAYQEQQAETKRTVVETPNARREVMHSEAVRYPERSGFSGGAVAAVVIAVIALATVVILFVMNRQDTTNANVAQTPAPTTIVQQPAQQPPVIVQQPGPATQPAPVVVNNPPTSSGTNPAVPDDSTIQAAIDKKLSNDPNLASLGIVASVVNGKVTLTGTVKTESLKAQAERAVRNLKGVKAIDNQISVG